VSAYALQEQLESQLLRIANIGSFWRNSKNAHRRALAEIPTFAFG
jgi:hypothetical protein